MQSSPEHGPTRAPVEVPLINPRYERKTRLNRVMAVTDSSDTDGRSPGELLHARAREALSVKQGPVSHSEEVSYHAYAMYRHGSRQIHTQSVGYTSDGDLVLTKREVAVESDSDPNKLKRVHVAVESSVCLNSKARPTSPITDGELDAKWQKRLPKLKKYPGVKCPKNRRIRNRLENDHMARGIARQLYEQARSDNEDALPETQMPNESFIPRIPRGMQWLLNCDEDEQRREMAKLGLRMPGDHRDAGRGTQIQPGHPDSAAFRFAQLSNRMRGDLHHAFTATEFMPGFMTDLDRQFVDLIVRQVEQPNATIELTCQDGYGRLIVHGVATYYKLQSRSVNNAQGERVTIVTLPKKPIALPDLKLTSYLAGENRSPDAGNSPTTPDPGPRPSFRDAQRLSKKAFALPPAMTSVPRENDDDQPSTPVRRLRFRRRILRAANGFRVPTPVGV